MFETFNTPAMYVAIQAVLSLYASGRTTGQNATFLNLLFFFLQCGERLPDLNFLSWFLQVL